MRLIGLTGKAGAGKDTVAGELATHAFLRYAFADPLKEMINVLLGHLGEPSPSGTGGELRDRWSDREWKEKPLVDIGKSPRQLAQTLGTEWGRNLVHHELWLILADKAITATRRCREVGGLVITDVRFENEARFIRSRGGEIWHVIGRQAHNVTAHVSEAGIGLYHGLDSVIDNSGDFIQLTDQVERALNGELVADKPKSALTAEDAEDTEEKHASQ